MEKIKYLPLESNLANRIIQGPILHVWHPDYWLPFRNNTLHYLYLLAWRKIPAWDKQKYHENQGDGFICMYLRRILAHIMKKLQKHFLCV